MPASLRITAAGCGAGFALAMAACAAESSTAPSQLPVVEFVAETGVGSWRAPTDSLAIAYVSAGLALTGRIAVPTPCQALTAQVALRSDTLALSVEAREVGTSCTLNEVGFPYRAVVRPGGPGTFVLVVSHSAVDRVTGRAYRTRIVAREQVVVR